MTKCSKMLLRPLLILFCLQNGGGQGDLLFWR